MQFAQQNNWGGQKGRRIRVTTNSFEITRLPTKIFYQYRVEILPDIRAARRRTEIIDRLQGNFPQIFTPRPLFDGQNIMFSSKRIDDQIWEINMSNRPLPPGRPPYRISVAFTNVINPTDVNRLINQREDSATTKVATNLLQMLIRQAPSMKYAQKGRSYFTEADRMDLPGGLELWRGFFQSVRPSIGKMLVNIDISMCAMHARGRLIDYCMQVINVRDVSRLRLRSRDPPFLALRKALKNVVVTLDTDTAPEPSKRRRKIRGLIEMAGQYKFDKADAMGNVTPMTVAQYYEVTYRRRLQFPDIIGIQLGNNNNPVVIPAEICFIPAGQVYKAKLPEQFMDQARKFSTKKPYERIEIIKNGVSKAGQRLIDPPALVYQNSDFLLDAGMQISPNPLSIEGRVLAPPQIRFRGSGTVTPNFGAWQTLRNQLKEPVQVGPWAVINLAMNISDGEAREIAQILVKSCDRLGINIQMPPPSFYRRGMEASSVLEELLSGPKLSLVLVLLPERAGELRSQVKRWGDVQTGVMTQCLKESNIKRAINDFRSRDSDQYTNNVALKINAKLGGVNSDAWCEVIDKLSQAAYMVCGADVSHPAPGIQNRPSVASLVWSHDPFATQYAAYTRVQAPHTESIEDLGAMMAEALYKFGLKNNKKLPRRILFFRDGVSEGEYRTVAEMEIKKIEEAITQLLATLPIPKDEPKPTLTFIVVGKRHHVRFFPSSADEDRSKNCPAGFVADKGLTSPIAVDFYLQSHAGILGTSRPSHYVVLKDENFGYSADVLQELAWSLCHVYAKANRSVSIPAPVYYADIVCSRAEFYFSTHLRFAEEGTTTSGSGDMFDLNKWREGFGENGKGPSKVWSRMFFV